MCPCQLSIIVLLSGGVVAAAILLGLVAFRRRLRSAFLKQRPVNRDVPQDGKYGNEKLEDHGLSQYSVPERDLVPDSSSTRAMSEIASTRSASPSTA
jgi:hypothetical protein